MMMETEGMGGGLAEPEFGGFFDEEPAEGGEGEASWESEEEAEPRGRVRGEGEVDLLEDASVEVSAVGEIDLGAELAEGGRGGESEIEEEVRAGERESEVRRDGEEEGGEGDEERGDGEGEGAGDLVTIEVEERASGEVGGEAGPAMPGERDMGFFPSGEDDGSEGEGEDEGAEAEEIEGADEGDGEVESEFDADGPEGAIDDVGHGVMGEGERAFEFEGVEGEDTGEPALFGDGAEVVEEIGASGESGEEGREEESESEGGPDAEDAGAEIGIGGGAGEPAGGDEEAADDEEGIDGVT